MKKWAIAAIALAAVAFMAAYIGSPWLAADELKAAALSGDPSRLERDIDFPAVRESLKTQVTAVMTKSAHIDASNNNPFAAMASALLPVIANRMVDAMVTPDAVAHLITRGEAPKLDAENSGDGAPKKPRSKLTYQSLDSVQIELINPDQPDMSPALILHRQGLFGWKLTKIALPEKLLSPANAN